MAIAKIKCLRIIGLQDKLFDVADALVNAQSFQPDDPLNFHSDIKMFIPVQAANPYSDTIDKFGSAVDSCGIKNELVDVFRLAGNETLDHVLARIVVAHTLGERNTTFLDTVNVDILCGLVLDSRIVKILNANTDAPHEDHCQEEGDDEDTELGETSDEINTHQIINNGREDNTYEDGTRDTQKVSKAGITENACIRVKNTHANAEHWQRTSPH